MITVRKRAPSPLFDLARALITRNATSTGAIAFSAPTNTVPRIPTAVAPGAKIPINAPITRPITILRTKLVEVHFFAIDFNFFPSFDLI